MFNLVATIQPSFHINYVIIIIMTTDQEETSHKNQNLTAFIYFIGYKEDK